MSGDDRLKAADGELFDFTTEHFTGGVSNPDSFKLNVVLEEEFQQLERNVDVGVSAYRAMLLDCDLTTRECVLVNLRLDLLWRVSQEDSRISFTRRHFSLGSLKCWEES